jgi:hypothetical protein
VNGSIGARLQLRGESVERQCCVLRSQPRASGEDNSAAVSPTAGTAYRTMNAGAAPVRRPSRNACAKFGIGLAFTERKPRPRQRWSARRGRGRAIRCAAHSWVRQSADSRVRRRPAGASGRVEHLGRARYKPDR